MRALCLALAALGPGGVHANSDLTSLSLEQLLQVKVVGASKYVQSQSEVAAAVSVITRDEIRDFGWRTLEQALASLPGVHMTYDRQYVYLGTRGFGLPGDYNTRLLVTVNGNRLNDVNYDAGPMGRQLPIDLQLVERIEFIPGPGGAVYGQNAMFGVVNLVTRDAASIDGVEATLSMQHPQRMRFGRVSWGRQLDNGVDLLLSASRMKSRGEDHFYDFGKAGVSGTARGQDGERDTELFARVAQDNWSAELLYGTSRKDDPTGVFFSDPLVPGQFQGDDYLVAQWQFRHELSDSLSMNARLFAGREKYHSILRYEGLPYGFPAMSEWRGGELRLLSTAFEGHKLLLGLEAQENARAVQQVQDLTDRANDFSINSPGYRIGFFVQDEWQVAPTLAATFGLRVDRNDRTGTEVSPRAALIWQAAPKTTLKTLLGRAHRAPNAYEQDYDDGLTQVANPSLRGETVDTLELVADQRIGSDLLLRASVYRWVMRDIITLVEDEDSGLTQYRSGETVGARGVELSADKTWAWGGRLRANLSLQRARSGGAELPNAPARIAGAHFSAPLPWAGLRLGASWRAESGRLTLAGDRLGGVALTALHLRASGWAPGLELGLTVRNLFDKRYAHPASDVNWQPTIRQDGRSVHVEARLHF